ncbi:BET1-like protein, putative [Leishmania donovani]|uniref:BET1-like protein, putative n=1 Tax=Leishmania donovani TaxID=5661 RepID=E9BKL1_LEIDO|nr:BET1-like protein, putative [Leishmania donovani]CBZ35789.1 BET1-like protein, putative [Leishmania donovani]
MLAAGGTAVRVCARVSLRAAVWRLGEDFSVPFFSVCWGVRSPFPSLCALLL